VTKSLYQFSMQSPDKKQLYEAAQKLEHEVSRITGLRDVTTDIANQSPQVNVEIDRDKAAAMQVNAQLIENAFYDAYGPRWVSTIYAAVNEYKVLLELKPEYQADPNALALLYLKANGGPATPGTAAASGGATAAAAGPSASATSSTGALIPLD